MVIHLVFAKGLHSFHFDSHHLLDNQQQQLNQDYKKLIMILLLTFHLLTYMNDVKLMFHQLHMILEQM